MRWNGVSRFQFDGKSVEATTETTESMETTKTMLSLIFSFLDWFLLVHFLFTALFVYPFNVVVLIDQILCLFLPSSSLFFHWFFFMVSTCLCFYSYRFFHLVIDSSFGRFYICSVFPLGTFSWFPSRLFLHICSDTINNNFHIAHLFQHIFYIPCISFFILFCYVLRFVFSNFFPLSSCFSNVIHFGLSFWLFFSVSSPFSCCRFYVYSYSFNSYSFSSSLNFPDVIWNVFLFQVCLFY